MLDKNEVAFINNICTQNGYLQGLNPTFVNFALSDKPGFSQINRPMGCKGTCMDYKPHWVSNSLNSVGFCEKPARVGTDTLQYYTEISIFGHLCTPISRKLEFSRHSRLCGLNVHLFYCKSH